MNKKLFLVLGPESTGNHLTSRVLNNMGCFWEENQKLIIDRFTRGECELKDITENPNIVLRRSVPYEHEWPDPVRYRKLFAGEGYKMYTIILQREWMAAILSQYYHRSATVEVAWDTLVKAEKHISKYISDGSVDPFYVLNTSTLMKDPEPVIRGLEVFTGLKWPIDIRYESVVKDPDINRHELLLNEGFKSHNRAIHHKYFKNRKPLVIR
jgi:hypothetical protein